MAYGNLQAQESNITHKVQEISPELAEKWLGKATQTTGMDKRQISAYARDMKAGMWKLNGDPVIFAEDGALLAGRLRLKACVEAGTPFQSLVIQGVSADTFLTIDAVRRRTVSDIMTIRKEPHGRALASALKLIWRAANGDLERQTKKVSYQELVDIIDKNPTIRRSLKLTKEAHPQIPHGIGGALHFLFQNEDREAADDFFEQFSTAEDSNVHSSVAALWRQLNSEYLDGGRRISQQVIGLSIKAWNAFKDNREVSLLRFAYQKEKFPDIPGLSEIDCRIGSCFPKTSAPLGRKKHPATLPSTSP